MRISSYRTSGRFTLQMGMTLSEIETIFGRDKPDGKYVTLYGSWQEGLIIKARDNDPHKSTELEGPYVKLQKRTGSHPYYIQIAGSRIEGNPDSPFKPFDSEMILTGENKEDATFIIPKNLTFKEGHVEAPITRKDAPPLNTPPAGIPIMRCVEIINIYIGENTDIFVMTDDGKAHKAIQLVKRAFVPL